MSEELNDTKQGPGLRDVLRKIALIGEEDVLEYLPAISDRLKKTFHMAMFWFAVTALMMVAYILLASVEYNNHQAILQAAAVAAKEGKHVEVPDASNWFGLVWDVCVIVMTIITFTLTVTLSRAWLYGGAMIIAENVALAIANAVYSFASFLIPDFIENRWDKDKRLEKKLEEATDKKSLTYAVENAIQSYAGILAWVIFIPWLMLNLPLVIFSHPFYVLMAMLGVAILVYQIYGWNSEPFWYELIKQGATYATASIVLINLVLLPIIRSTGVFEGWGPSEAGYIRTGFWFIIIVTVAAIAFSGFEVVAKEVDENASEEDKNKSKKHSFKLVPKNLAVSGVILAAAFMFGNLFLNTVLGATKPVSNPQGNGDGNTAANTAFHLPSLPDMTSITKKFYNPDAKAPEVDMGSGPFYKNPDQTLLPRVSYKFATSNTVYVYKDDGKLHRFQDGGALFSYYGCAGGQRVIDCTSVYEIPARVKPGDSILGGAVVNGSE